MEKIGPTFNANGVKFISEYYFKKLQRLKNIVTVDDLSPFEFVFLESFWERTTLRGRSIVITMKQEDILRNICRKFEI